MKLENVKDGVYPINLRNELSRIMNAYPNTRSSGFTLFSLHDERPANFRRENRKKRARAYDLVAEYWKCSEKEVRRCERRATHISVINRSRRYLSNQ